MVDTGYRTAPCRSENIGTFLRNLDQKVRYRKIGLDECSHLTLLPSKEIQKNIFLKIVIEFHEILHRRNKILEIKEY